MARPRRTSAVLETARQRLAGLKSINPTPDFGASLSVSGFEAKTESVHTRLNSYNQKVAQLDDESHALDSEEAELKDLNRRILSAVEAQFGPDSSEYDLVGGTRTSDRKRPLRKAAGATAPPKP